MREIKFRGFDVIGRKGWVYGDLAHNLKCTETGLENRVMVGGYEVDPESVGMFIGCQDSEGYKVYEGDIVRISENEQSRFLLDLWETDTAVVEYIDYSFCLVCCKKRDDGVKRYAVLKSIMNFVRFKVIGNIYNK